MASIVSPPSSSPLAPVVEADSIVAGACFPDQKSCTKAMRQYAVSDNMVVKLAAEHGGGAVLMYQCAGRSRLTAIQVQEDELIRSLAASDNVLVDVFLSNILSAYVELRYR
ncbi:SAM-dependent methyltransferase [Phytophthora palmivora]|uniref:SAM-dependent methyltransferase n=1 Tax=Phytophthora palmivora TaxID=4796 RepID=A0A2P4XED2_9STRA|nr:SAM-dependent methyltransferase [Phytophthora palmivora]